MAASMAHFECTGGRWFVAVSVEVAAIRRLHQRNMQYEMTQDQSGNLSIRGAERTLEHRISIPISGIIWKAESKRLGTWASDPRFLSPEMRHPRDSAAFCNPGPK
jgi:hypothetical protein